MDEMLPDLPRWRGDHDVVVGKEVGVLGTMFGQWMCAERRWMYSMIDMTVPSISSYGENVVWPGHDSGVIVGTGVV